MVGWMDDGLAGSLGWGSSFYYHYLSPNPPPHPSPQLGAPPSSGQGREAPAIKGAQDAWKWSVEVGEVGEAQVRAGSFDVLVA